MEMELLIECLLNGALIVFRRLIFDEFFKLVMNPGCESEASGTIVQRNSLEVEVGTKVVVIREALMPSTKKATGNVPKQLGYAKHVVKLMKDILLWPWELLLRYVIIGEQRKCWLPLLSLMCRTLQMRFHSNLWRCGKCGRGMCLSYRLPAEI